MTTEMDPAELEPPHEVRDTDKLARLVVAMERDGWQGEPILLVGEYNDAWTGSHRIAAAREAGIDVPVYRWIPTSAQAEILRYCAPDQDGRLTDLTYFEDRGAEPCDPEALRLYEIECGKGEW